MNIKQLREMSAKFSLYVSFELRGAISASCISQAEVCRRIGRQLVDGCAATLLCLLM